MIIWSCIEVLTYIIQSNHIGLKWATWLTLFVTIIFQQQLVRLQSKSCSRNVKKPKIQIIDVSDAIWRWLHQKYGMGQIIWKLHSINKKTDLILLLSMMFHEIDKTMT